MATVEQCISCPAEVLSFLECLESVLCDKVLLGAILRESLLSHPPAFEPISKILKSLQHLIDYSGGPNAVSWTKLWTKFHRYHQEDLLTAWQTISDMSAVELDPILSQSTTECLLLKLVRDVSSHPNESPTIPTTDLSAMEELG